MKEAAKAMTVRDLMTPHVEVVSPESTLREAAELMRAVDAGALPVVSMDAEVIGMVTDRDIVVRGLALGCSADATVSEVMSLRVLSVRETDSVEDAVAVMHQAQVRRLVVTDGEGRLVGMLSLVDLVGALPEAGMGALVGVLSEPASSLLQ